MFLREKLLENPPPARLAVGELHAISKRLLQAFPFENMCESKQKEGLGALSVRSENISKCMENQAITNIPQIIKKSHGLHIMVAPPAPC